MSAGTGTGTGTGAIASPHTLATRAGADAYSRGGNALDAALAAAAVLTVVYPHNTSIGGDLVAIVRTPDGAIRCVNATGSSPSEQTVERLRAKHGSILPVRGPDTITVPGSVRGWESIRGFGARLPWHAQFRAAIEHAEAGVPVARSLAGAILQERLELHDDPGSSALFLPDGRPLERGALLRQPALAGSLEAIATGGADELYEGGLGSTLVRGLRRQGSLITEDDLRSFTPEIVETLSTPFDAYTVHTSPPNTQGFALIRTIRALGILGAHPADPADLARLFADGAVLRDTLLADPRYSRIDLVEHGFDALMASFGRARDIAGGTGGPLVLPSGDTIGIAAADSEGYAVSLIQSLYYSFGAMTLEPDTGIQLQNRGMSFSLDPSSPNRFEPGKRPRHTLMPVLVTEDARVRWVNATMGGHAQAQIHAQLLLGLTDGLSPQEAVSAPRWVLGRRAADDPVDKIYVEEDVAPSTVARLAADGFDVGTTPRASDWIGHANIVSIDHGVITAGSDPRADGSAAVTAIGEPPTPVRT